MRRDTGETYQDFLTKLAQASGIETPTRADLAQLDRKRKKKGSNDDWTHPHDPDAKITKMKDGRTHLAHKAEHAVDLETGAIVGVTRAGRGSGRHDDDSGDVARRRRATRSGGRRHRRRGGGRATKSSPTRAITVGRRCSTSRRWGFAPTSANRIAGRSRGSIKQAARDAVYANRRRIRGDRGQRLLRRRGELLERPFAHLYETGGMRRTHLRGHDNILKRLLVHAGAFNLGLWMRTLSASARRAASRAASTALGAALSTLCAFIYDANRRTLGAPHAINEISCYRLWIRRHRVVRLKNATCTTGC